MPSLIAFLSKRKQQELLEDLNYLNMSEIKAFCNRHSIPYSIWIETKDGVRRKTQDNDRKGVILDRIRYYLRTGNVMDATCFPASIVCFDELPQSIKTTDHLLYGQCDTKNGAVVDLLKKLTDGQFKDGAIARILLRELWSKGISPTYQEYALAWLTAKAQHRRPNAEWAFLSDRSDHKDTSNWKQLRTKKAKRVLSILNKLDASKSA
jgi:hypothetical protein